MATYAFKAVDLAGVPARGELEAPDKQAVTDQLRQRGLIVLDINEQKVAVSSQDLFDRFKKVSARDLTVMTRQLATMVASGMSILGAFHVLEEQTENDKLKEILVQVRSDIEAGISLSDALAKHPNVFNRLYVSMARTGEMAGMLEESLMRVAELLEKQDSLRRQVRGAMAYPMMIGIFSLVVLLALVAFLIPVFEDVFKQQNGAKLPFITQISVSASHALTQRWYLIIAGTVGMVFLVKKWKRSEMGTAQWDTIKLKIPAKIGDAIHKIALARWSRTFSGLVHAGVPILQAIEITGATAGNVHLERDGRGPGLRPERRDDRRAAAQEPDVPDDGRPHGRRRRGDRKPGRDARQDRRLLRGRGGRRREGPHLDTRAGDDHHGRRDRRVHRDLDVPAALPGLRQHPLAVPAARRRGHGGRRHELVGSSVEVARFRAPLVAFPGPPIPTCGI